MAETEKPRLTVITNSELNSPTEKEINYSTNPLTGESANPYYQKLLEFNKREKRKRFSVEDLLR
jgi:hypothetical protein